MSNANPDNTISQNLLIDARNLKVHYPIKGGIFRQTKGWVRAVDGVNINLDIGEIVSIVGESGCGKSTLGNAMLGLVKSNGGELFIEGHKIESLKDFKRFRKDFQFIFQDPYSALNPRHTIYEIISEPLLVHKIVSKKESHNMVASLLDRVGLSPDYMGRYPHSFSGGQRQRICIARAIGLNPKAIICDEIVAALDVSVQAQIINLLLALKEEMNLSLLFISHDLSLIRFLSDRLYVMYLGDIVESGKCSDIFLNPAHPYTKSLLESIPTLDRSKKPIILEGEVPSPVNKPAGCPFHTRCTVKRDDCEHIIPEMHPVHDSDDHQAACLYV